MGELLMEFLASGSFLFFVIMMGVIGACSRVPRWFRRIEGMLVTIVEATAQCSRPLPGPGLPWERCSGGCSWCDHMAEFDREEVTEDHSGPALGPYRTLEEKRDDWEADQQNDDMEEGHDIRLVLQCNSQMHREDVFVALHGAGLITTSQYHSYIISKPEWIGVALDQPKPGRVR